MPLVYKTDVQKALNDAGYNSTRIYKERQLSQDTMQRLRTGKMIGMQALERICELLDEQPGEIIGYEKHK